MTPEDLMTGLRQTLIEIGQRLPAHINDWNENRVLQLAIQKLWIDAGNFAESYRKDIGSPVATDPWSELVMYRGILAHGLPGEVSLERVYRESTEVPRLLAEVNAAAHH